MTRPGTTYSYPSSGWSMARLLKPKEAAELLGVGTYRLREWAQVGLIVHAMTVGGQFRYSAEQIGAVADGRHQVPGFTPGTSPDPTDPEQEVEPT